MRIALALAAALAATPALAQETQFFGVEAVPHSPVETRETFPSEYVRPDARIIQYDNSGWQPGEIIPCADQGFRVPTVGRPGPVIGRNPDCANRVADAWRLTRR